MFPATYQVPAAVILLGGGLLSCFVGHRLFRVVLGIYGFVAGALVASAIFGPGDPQGALLSMLIGGVVGALVLILAYFVGVALVGAALGAILIHVIWAQLGREPHPFMVIAGTVAGALGALALQRYVIIAATAFAGAWTGVGWRVGDCGRAECDDTGGLGVVSVEAAAGLRMDVDRVADVGRGRPGRAVGDEAEGPCQAVIVDVRWRGRGRAQLVRGRTLRRGRRAPVMSVG